MKPIKLLLKKGGPLGYSWSTYREIDRILIDDNSIIKTEAQLAYYIYRKFGVGRYQIIAWQKGHEGFWLYWLGNINPNGFIRDIRKNKELSLLKRELRKSGKEDEEEIHSQIEIERKISRLERGKKSGPVGLKTLRPGMLHSYEEF